MKYILYLQGNNYTKYANLCYNSQKKEGACHMDIKRQEILPGVWMNILENPGSCAGISINFLTQLSREDAAFNAAIPYILCQGSKSLPSPEMIADKLSAMGGASLCPVVRKIGEVQSLGILCTVPDGAHIADMIRFAGQVIADPATKGGLFLQDNVSAAAAELEDILDAADDPSADGYSIRACAAGMCCYEDYSINEYGNADDIRSINYVKISKYYKEFIRRCPVEIILTGDIKAKKAASLLKDALCILPRGELDDEIGTDIRLNAVEDSARTMNEELEDIAPAAARGYRVGDWMDEPDPAVLEVFKELTGGYIDAAKGILIICGSAFDPAAFAAELAADTLNHAKAAAASKMAALLSNPAELDSFILSQMLIGFDYSPDVMMELIKDVTADDIAALCSSLECDYIYTINFPEESNSNVSE